MPQDKSSKIETDIMNFFVMVLIEKVLEVLWKTVYKPIVAFKSNSKIFHLYNPSTV